MKEIYVKFGTAKLLREKGFNWECLARYDKPIFSNNVSIFTEANAIDWNTYYYGSDYKFSAPTQQMACRWLREVHKIDISVTPDDGSWWIKITELESWSSVFNGKVLNSDDIKYAYEGDTSTKEGCYEAGLWYVLKNLI